MLEIKVIMVMTLRNYEVNLMYEELQSAKPIRTVYGQRGYQIQRAQPSNDLPCRVTKVLD